MSSGVHGDTAGGSVLSALRNDNGGGRFRSGSCAARVEIVVGCAESEEVGCWPDDKGVEA